MSSPFQKAFSAKSPLYKSGVVTLSEEEIKSSKSASASKPSSIGVEGQGGTDYESPDYDNVEGQGGIDYEAEDYKKKTKVSPLSSYANPGGEVYLSDQPSFQKLQSDIQGAADKVIASATDDLRKKFSTCFEYTFGRKNELVCPATELPKLPLVSVPCSNRASDWLKAI